MQLLVALQRREVAWNRSTKARKAVPKARQPARQRIVEARSTDGAEGIGVAITHRYQAKVSAIAHQDREVGQARWTDGEDAAPHHSTGILR